MKKRHIIFLRHYPYLFALLLVLLVSWTDKKPIFRNGIYRSVVTRPDGKDIVFNFQSKDSAGKKILYVLNADEKLLVDNVAEKDDSVFIQMPFFESGFRAAIDAQGNLQGQWIKRFADREQILPFTAKYNEKQRFVATAKPAFNVSGRWDATFIGKKNDTTKAIGEFSQTGAKITGTFLTSTGDYRYLEGVVSRDSLVLSGFDGGHAFLFTAKIDDANNLSGGNFYSGATSVESWVAKKDEKIELPDGYQQTKLHEGESKLNFYFKSLDGEDVSINDNRFKNKVVVVQILGSWCPNCMDETNFLSDYYNRNKQKGVEIVGLAYERTTDFERSKSSLQRFVKRFNVQYPVLITGVTVSDLQRTEKTLPQLTEIKGFPTSIFIDKKGNVRKVYTGFNGPGTGEHYKEFQKEFDETINGLLNE
ncbi:peroxiredoxin family protein [Segetibacter koreensis]|uniref:peroxiredoxin family protein n=1 Tax=Segetibacter koreensis TaxID=398037 RepID=UPI000367D7B3|nr:TlpA disulfide reductase family protein [Segetibacter koreensis]